MCVLIQYMNNINVCVNNNGVMSILMSINNNIMI